MWGERPWGDGSALGGTTCGPGGGREWGRKGRKQHAGRAQLLRLLAGYARGAHRKHGTVLRDFGHVEAQLLVERLRGLPRGKQREHGKRGRRHAEPGGWQGARAGGARKTCTTCP